MFTKRIFTAALLFLCATSFAQQRKTENVIFVTFDGYRWQELFTGADKKLVGEPEFVKDTAKLKATYWAATPKERRMQLMPFFWNTIAKQGMLIGNRKVGSRMNLTNFYKFSFPGYNEIFTGHKDYKINSNDLGDNPNRNIFDFFAEQKEYENQLVAVANWDAFPKILNTHRNKVPVYVNFKCSATGVCCNDVTYNNWQTTCPPCAPASMVDTITYHFAKEYIHRNHPKLAFIGFDETDHFAHEGHYDDYLATANMFDSYMQDLWNMIQTDTLYKDKTTLVITCDHGRGHAGKSRWRHHGVLAGKQVWMAVIGPDTPASGEVKRGKTYRTNQVAATLAKLLGQDFKIGHRTGKPIDIFFKRNN